MSLLSDGAVVVIATLAAVGVVVALAATGGPKSISLFVAAYFLLFGFGPVVNYLTGEEIYFGIALDAIPMATIGMLLALIGILAGSHLVRQRKRFDRNALRISDSRSYPTVVVFNLALTGYAIWVLATRGSALVNVPKTAKVQLAGEFHYQYLLVAMLISAFYFAATRSRFGTWAFWVQQLTYTTYCLVTDERDFIFVFFSLLLHTQLFRDRASMAKPALAGVGLACLATYLFSARSGESGDATTQALNQGSVLFVDSYIVSRYPDYVPYLGGETYLQAVSNVLPSWITGPHQTLADGLVQSYAPGSDSGYGFSLTAEAYMNFGWLGILALFVFLTVLLNLLVNRCDRSYFYAYASMAFTMAWMYAIRGESSSLVAFCVDALLLYGLVSATSWRRALPSEPHASEGLQTASADHPANRPVVTQVRGA